LAAVLTNDEVEEQALLVGLEVVSDKQSKKPAPGLGAAILDQAIGDVAG
jgi:hypothetical protein